MYTRDNLTAEETAKLQAGLRLEFPTIMAHRNLSVRKMDQQDMIEIDTWMQVGDSPAHYYWIRETSFPADWTGANYIDFIVQLAKGAWVKKIGIFREFPFTDIPMTGDLRLWGAEEIYSPSEMIRLASQGASPGVQPNYTLTVHVSDQSNNPIVGARVEVSGNVQLTNSMGDATFTIPGGGYTLTISQTGYQSTSSPITLDTSKTLRYALVKEVPQQSWPSPVNKNKGTTVAPTSGFINQLAGSLHISRQTAEVVLIGGAGLLLVFFLRKKKKGI